MSSPVIVPVGISTKYDLGFLVLCNNIPGSLVLSLRHQTFVLFAIFGRFLTFL